MLQRLKEKNCLKIIHLTIEFGTGYCNPTISLKVMAFGRSDIGSNPFDSSQSYIQRGEPKKYHFFVGQQAHPVQFI